MFEVMKHLDLLLENKKGFRTGLFETRVDKYSIKTVYWGNNFSKKDKAQKQIPEYRFKVKDHEHIDPHEWTTFGIVDFVKLMQTEELFDEFKWNLEEYILENV